MKNILNGYLELLFPKICACCGGQLAGRNTVLCEFCKYGRFEFADSCIQEISDEVHPEFVEFRIALWQFDKGGYLQDLLHRLKYEYLYGVGIDFGIELGKIIQRVVASAGYSFCYRPLLVPVPLHQKKKRQRGYNQAYAICEGISTITGWTIIDEKAIKRIRNTQTQTGLTFSERKQNLSGAFRVDDIEFVSYEMPIIIDDVFTTGSTVMELSETLNLAGAQKIGIATLAEA